MVKCTFNNLLQSVSDHFRSLCIKGLNVDHLFILALQQMQIVIRIKKLKNKEWRNLKEIPNSKMPYPYEPNKKTRYFWLL